MNSKEKDIVASFSFAIVSYYLKPLSEYNFDSRKN